MRGCTYLSPVCRFGHTRRLRNRTTPDEKGGEDMTTASLLIVLIAGTAVGAIVGLALGGGIDLWYLALLFLVRPLRSSCAISYWRVAPGLDPTIPARRLWSWSLPQSPRSAPAAWRLKWLAQRSRRFVGLDRNASRFVRLDPARHVDGDLPRSSGPDAEAPLLARGRGGLYPKASFFDQREIVGNVVIGRGEQLVAIED